MLAAITVVCTLLSGLVKNGILNWLLWLVQLVGSIWLLKIFMNNYGKAHPGEATFGYGFAVCLMSSVICGAWAFVMAQYIFPDSAADAFAQARLIIEQTGQDMTDEVNDTFQYVEDNYSKLNSVSTFIKCVIEGLIFSAIINTRNVRTGSAEADPEQM